MKYYYLLLPALILASCGKDKNPAPAATPDITSGLVINIPFDGTAVELVSNTNGLVNKATPISDHHGVSNKAMHFVGSDSATIDFGSLPGTSFINNQFTISCWVRVTDTTKDIAILSKRALGGPWEYSLDNHFGKNHFDLDNWVNDGGASVYGTDPLKASANIQLNTWMHIAYVANGANLVVYINGTLQPGADSYNTGLSFSQTGGHLVIGDGGAYGQNEFFSGDIDDIRMYNKALDAATIQYLAGL